MHIKIIYLPLERSFIYKWNSLSTFKVCYSTLFNGFKVYVWEVCHISEACIHAEVSVYLDTVFAESQHAPFIGHAVSPYLCKFWSQINKCSLILILKPNCLAMYCCQKAGLCTKLLASLVTCLGTISLFQSFPLAEWLCLPIALGFCSFSLP